MRQISFAKSAVDPVKQVSEEYFYGLVITLVCANMRTLLCTNFV